MDLNLLEENQGGERMFSGFNLITGHDYEHYYSKGKEIYKNTKGIIKENLDRFIDSEGALNGTKMQDNWFPQINADIFISHSHKDERQAIGLAGWLYERFGLKAFIDSCVWGYSGELLKMIDNRYCLQSDGKTYSYELRNYSTSHVHMMLSTALTMMIDKTECLFFLNTPRSLSAKEVINNTESPWIYHELAMTKFVRKRKLKEYRMDVIKKSFELAEAGKENLVVKYDVTLDHLHELTQEDLTNWMLLNNRSKHNYSLDILYAYKNIAGGKVLNG